jgi:uridine kinase
VLVGVDGRDAAGKTTVVDRLAEALPVPTLRVSIDGFQQPRELRYQRGDLSAERATTRSITRLRSGSA